MTANILNPVALQADLMRQGFMKAGSKAAKYRVTAIRDEEGMLLHPDRRDTHTRKEATATAKLWSAMKGVKFTVETL